MSTVSSSHSYSTLRPEAHPWNASRYRSLAATVRAYLLEVNSVGERPIDSYVSGDLQAMRRLLSVGQRYSESGSLDTTHSSADAVDLGLELPDLAVGDLAAVRPGGQIDMRRWTELADHVLGEVQNGAALDADDRGFLQHELLPLLTKWMDLPPLPIRE